MGKSILRLGALIACVWVSPALAGGGYCEPSWHPENPDLDCASQVAISPGNDSRVNLYLLLQDRAGNDGANLGYPDLDWYTFYGRNFFRWQNLRDAWFPPSEPAEGEGRDGWSIYRGDRCQTIGTGRAAFLAALADSTNVMPAARTLIAGSRETLGKSCEDGPGSVTLPEDGMYYVNLGDGGIDGGATGFMAYLEASASFYAGEWQRAWQYYSMLRDSDVDPWLTETATYMLARTALNEAIESGDDEWAWFDLEKVKQVIAKRSEDGFRAYLARYPDGRYASSAQGLIRKTLWLQRDFAGLAVLYGDLLQRADPVQESTATIVEEVDDKWIVPAGGTHGGDPMLAAVDHLMRMRSWNYDPQQKSYGARPLTEEELEAQEEIFADHPDLYGFLKANHAFYVAKDYRLARDLLPDDARQNGYTPLAFSRQYLRGLALHALGDRNEEGFWLELIGGAKGLYQRPAVELALARLYEQQGRVDKVFAPGSPVADSRIRRILLANSAGPEVLKQQLRAGSASTSERAFALFTVLLKQLQRGEYAGFSDDFPFTASFSVPSDGSDLWNVMDAEMPALQLFTAGAWSDGYACPSIDRTAKRLARDPRDVNGRLCLGDFYRLNGFDDFRFGRVDAGEFVDDARPAALGERDMYPGAIIPRHDFYTSIMADRGASREQRAYALYRAIRCYAPANSNTCGGPGVAEDRREAWFRTIKRDYADTRWAKELEYYW